MSLQKKENRNWISVAIMNRVLFHVDGHLKKLSFCVKPDLNFMWYFWLRHQRDSAIYTENEITHLTHCTSQQGLELTEMTGRNAKKKKIITLINETTPPKIIKVIIPSICLKCYGSNSLRQKDKQNIYFLKFTIMHYFSMHSNYYYNAYLRRSYIFYIIFCSYYNKAKTNCFNEHFILSFFILKKIKCNLYNL